MKLLICKDFKSNAILESKNLNETDSIKYLVIEDAPEIEQREGYTGHYELDSNGEIIVVYEEIPKTEIELIKEQLLATQMTIIEITEDMDSVENEEV